MWLIWAAAERCISAANPADGCIDKKPCYWLQVATLTAERDSMASQNMTLASTTSKLMAATAGDSSPHGIQDPADSASATLGSSAAVAALNASASISRSNGHADATGSGVAADEMRSDARAARGGAVLTAAQVGQS
jgi:hypothetical protein